MGNDPASGVDPTGMVTSGAGNMNTEIRATEIHSVIEGSLDFYQWSDELKTPGGSGGVQIVNVPSQILAYYYQDGVSGGGEEDPNSYTVDLTKNTTVQTDNKGGDQVDYITYIMPTANGLSLSTLRETPVQARSVEGAPMGVVVRRTPGFIFKGSPYTGKAEMVDDPFTSLGPGAVRYAGVKMMAFAERRMLALGMVKSGEISKDVARSFRFSTFTKITLDQPLVLARYYDDVAAFAKGRYMTNTLSNSRFLDRMGLALRPKWNAMTKTIYWEVPSGTTVYRGKAAMQFPWVGGKTQYFIPNIDNLIPVRH